MSNIAAGTTSTTALVATADTTGALVFQTGASATTAMTISSTQTVSFANLLNYYTASLGANVNLTVAGTYYDGPSVAQGSSGTWFVSGTVCVADTATTSEIDCKLWDGTNLIASGGVVVSAANAPLLLSLSGVIVSPSGNLRISVRDATTTSARILYNYSGLAKDSTITAIRIA